MSDSADLSIEVVVVGGGIVGVAVARELAFHGCEVLVIERETRLGQHQSSRNSSVVHAGFYYQEKTLKARICREANRRLYEYAEQRSISYRRIGKMVVSSNEVQLLELEKLSNCAASCGIDDVVMLDRHQAKTMEPHLTCVAALWSPSTGVIDTTALLQALIGDAQDRGVIFSTASDVTGGHFHGGKWCVYVSSGGLSSRIKCRLLVNCAGLGAPHFARRLDGYPPERVPDFYLARGHYFVCRNPVPFSRLIYPLPDSIGLGIHLTIDVDGQAKFGPDVQIVDEIEYNVNPDRASYFYESIRTFWPDLAAGSLSPSYAGIRAKIGKPGDFQDWIIDTPAEHGLPGLVSLIGIETPGMTCAMAIGREVADRLFGADVF